MGHREIGGWKYAHAQSKQYQKYLKYIQFYHEFKNPLVFKPISFPYDENGVNGYHAFQAYDGGGKILSTFEPEEARQAYIGKSNLSFHTEIWRQGIAEGTLFILELEEDFPYLPDFVFEELRNTKKRFI